MATINTLIITDNRNSFEESKAFILEYRYVRTYVLLFKLLVE